MVRETSLDASVVRPASMARHFLFETTDLDEACERVGQVFCKHRIDFAGRGRALASRQHYAALGRVALSHITYGEEVAIDAGEPEDWFMVHFIDRGRCAMKVGTHDLVASPRMSVITSATLPLHMTWTANCDHLVLKVDRAALERCLSVQIDDAVTRPLVFLPDMPNETQETACYRRTLDFVIRELDADDSFFLSQAGRRQLEDMLMHQLLGAFRHNYSQALAAPAGACAPRHVVRAEEFIRANAAQALTVEDIAAASGVGVRTLFEGFRRFRDTTPMARLKAVRLEGVREDLLAAAPEASVTAIAMNWGFSNLGRFADAYRRRYGELPSQTLKGMR